MRARGPLPCVTAALTPPATRLTFRREMMNTEKCIAGGADMAALHRVLIGYAGYTDIARDELEPMQAKGLFHAHARIRGSATILRIPRVGSFGLPPAANLDYQAASFARAAESGHVPLLHATISPRQGIPWGALVISEIEGGAPSLPGGLPAIARALAALHSVPVPPPPERPPLPSNDDPVRATLDVIEAQARFLDDAGLAPDTRRQIDYELAGARRFAADVTGQDMPIALVGTDTHPGNFMMQPDGTAMFVDIEKMLYGAPAIDLAHATVYTSTMWDADVAAALNADEVAAFYAVYFDALPRTLGDRIRPWCGPLRRFTWLRTTTWCAKWRVESQNGQAWSAAQHDPVYIASVRKRVDDYLDPETIARIRTGFDIGTSV